ncbi:hypothetical protein Tco_0675442 [Tanacetum coccineum]
MNGFKTQMKSRMNKSWNHIMYMAKIQAVLHATDDNSGPTYDVEQLEKVHTDDDYNVLATENSILSNINPLITHMWWKRDFVYVILFSLDDIDEYCDMACKYLEKNQECECLENELSKRHKPDHDKSFAQIEKHYINLELALQNAKEKSVCENSWVKQSFTSENIEKVLKAKNDSLIAELNRKTIEINDLNARLQYKTIVNAEMCTLLNKPKGKYVDTKFVKSSVVRQSNAFKFQKSSVLRKSSLFVNSLEIQFLPQSRFVPKANEKKDLSKPVTPHILPQNQKQAERNTNVIKPGMYRLNTSTQARTPQFSKTFKNSNPRVSTSTRVIQNTSVSMSQLKSNQMKDKVMPNNSQVMIIKKKVEDHHRSYKSSDSSSSLDAQTHDRKPQVVMVYYVEGLNHNLFSVGKICDADLEVAFRNLHALLEFFREMTYLWEIVDLISI